MTISVYYDTEYAHHCPELPYSAAVVAPAGLDHIIGIGGTPGEALVALHEMAVSEPALAAVIDRPKTGSGDHDG